MASLSSFFTYKRCIFNFHNMLFSSASFNFSTPTDLFEGKYRRDTNFPNGFYVLRTDVDHSEADRVI